MGSMFNAGDRAEMLRRLESLTVEDARQWGTMDVAGMAAHLLETARIAFAEKSVTVLATRPMSAWKRWLIIQAPLPWPKEKAKAPAEYFPPAYDPGALRAYIGELCVYMERFAQPPAEIEFGLHAYFGSLTPREWGMLTYKHTDHHLRQFGR